MSSEPKDYQSSPDLYCNESSEEIDLFQDYANLDYDHIFYSNSNSIPFEEISIINAFDSEVDQVFDSNLIRRLNNDPALFAARLEAVHWMLKVHGYYNFRPETAYLSVKYLDKVLLSTALVQVKGWTFQLLSVACLSLAAKMEEISVPLLLDLQMKESAHRFLFKPKTVQRMELMVMAILKWRLRTITPFDFLHYFVAKLSCFGLIKFEHYNGVVSQTSNIILLTCQEIDFLEHSPSTIAAAAALSATDQYLDDGRISGCFHPRVSRESVGKCYNLMKQSLCLLSHIKFPKIIEPLPSPDGVVSENCGGTEIRVAGI